MRWSDKCVLELTHRNLFENDAHRSRFRDFMDGYAEAPFFSKGLCKCMFMASWDDEHFIELLDALNSVTIAHDKKLTVMKDEGEFKEHKLVEASLENGDSKAGDDMLSPEGVQFVMWRLSNDMLNDRRFDRTLLKRLEDSDPDAAYTARQVLKAAQCIDDLPEINP